MAAAALVLIPALGQAEELPMEAQAAAQKRATLTSYRTRFTLEAREADGQLFQLEGTLLFRMPDHRRLEIRQAGSKEEPQQVISDGQVEWQSYPEGGVVYRVHPPPEAPGPHRPFSEAQSGTVRFVGAREVEEGKILQFEAAPRAESVDGSPVPIDKIQIEVAEKDGLAREMILLDAKGNAVMTQKFFDMQVNSPVSDEEFVYVAKQGVAVMELPPEQEKGS